MRVAFKFRAGTRCVRLPERYGNWQGIYNRLRMWAIGGSWERSSRADGPGRRQ